MTRQPPEVDDFRTEYERKRQEEIWWRGWCIGEQMGAWAYCFQDFPESRPTIPHLTSPDEARLFYEGFEAGFCTRQERSAETNAIILARRTHRPLLFKPPESHARQF